MVLRSQVVIGLVAPWHKSGRNITTDNFFTSVPLAEKLLKDGLTYVGTVRSIIPHIPEVMKAYHGRQIYSSLFGFRGLLTLVSCKTSSRGELKRQHSTPITAAMHGCKALLLVLGGPIPLFWGSCALLLQYPLNVKDVASVTATMTRRWHVCASCQVANVPQARCYSDCVPSLPVLHACRTRLFCDTHVRIRVNKCISNLH